MAVDLSLLAWWEECGLAVEFGRVFAKDSGIFTWNDWTSATVDGRGFLADISSLPFAAKFVLGHEQVQAAFRKALSQGPPPARLRAGGGPAARGPIALPPRATWCLNPRSDFTSESDSEPPSTALSPVLPVVSHAVPAFPPPDADPVAPACKRPRGQATPAVPLPLPNLTPAGANPVVPASKRPRGQATVALQIAEDPSALQAAIVAIRRDLYAPRTWAAHASEVGLYERVMAAAQLTAFPLDRPQLEAFCAVLKRAQYKAATQYVCAVVRQNRLFGYVLSQSAMEYRTMLSRALNRDRGASKQVLGIDGGMLRDMRAKMGGVKEVLIWKVMVVQWFFLLREAEVLALTPAQVEVDAGIVAVGPGGSTVRVDGSRPQVTIHLHKTKTNQAGSRISRTLACVCPSGDRSSLPLCPYHILLDLKTNQAYAPEAPFAPCRGVAPLSSTAYLDGVRACVTKLRVPTWSDEGGHLYGTHSLRRGGAQALARAGWTLADIKFFGRWLSDAVELYLLDVPMRAHGHELAASMAHGLKGASGDVRHGPVTLRPGMLLAIRLFIAGEEGGLGWDQVALGGEGAEGGDGIEPSGWVSCKIVVGPENMAGIVPPVGGIVAVPPVPRNGPWLDGVYIVSPAGGVAGTVESRFAVQLSAHDWYAL